MIYELFWKTSNYIEHFKLHIYHAIEYIRIM